MKTPKKIPSQLHKLKLIKKKLKIRTVYNLDKYTPNIFTLCFIVALDSQMLFNVFE